ncbi:MAG TPA: response regulator [Anaerolineae bacterium]|nr:response regulator [Anaerolineae bacterium]
MSEPSLPPTRETFAKWVRDVLNRLYDSPYLQTHPLATLLAEEEASATLHRSQNLRRVLLEAIRAMRPGPGVPAQSPDWRAYRILELRYIEGLSPNEVMSRLALGRSQYFRDQARVLDALTDALWDRWQKPCEEAVSTVDVGSTTREELIHLETERLCAHATWEAVDAAELLDDLRAVVDPLARTKDVSVCFTPLHHLTVLNADRVMLRQAILNTITYALDLARGGRVEISGFAEGCETGIRVAAWGPATTAQRQGMGLDVCRQLMAAMGGRLHLEAENGAGWEARLAWPAAVPRVLLVVDDNEGFVDLFRRYLAGHTWQVIGATSSTEARQIIAETRPTVIALDVMMPREDGWEFLIALKTSTETRDIPVIVCSVLNEPQLALTLGAVTYLAKPVTQQALLRALAPWNQASASLGPAR